MGRTMLSETLVSVIRIYQKIISPLLGPRCRYYPSCSEYAATCLRQYSFPLATKKTVLRLLRCRPGQPGGVDLP